jgi:hypothetical protein
MNIRFLKTPPIKIDLRNIDQKLLAKQARLIGDLEALRTPIRLNAKDRELLQGVWNLLHAILDYAET